jgi:hypothetical protein
MSFMTVLVIFLLVAAIFTAVGWSKWGFGAASPLGFFLLFILVLFLTGHLR